MERRIAAGLLAMEMSIDEILDRQRRVVSDRGFDLVMERRKFGIHHDDSVVADRRAKAEP